MISRQQWEAGQMFLSGARPAFATTLLSLLLRTYGLQVMEWEGETIQLEVKDDFHLEMPRKVYDQLMALLTALTTDEVYKDVAVFDEICSALNGRGLGVERDVPPVTDVAWAVTEIRINDPDPATRSPEQPWSRNIARYCRVVLDDEGMPIAPKALEFAHSRAVPAEGTDNPDYYAAAWGSAQARADEIDTIMAERTRLLIEQLMTVGVQFKQPVAS